MATITAGYRAYTGRVFTEKDATLYNRACERARELRRLRGPDSAAYWRALESQTWTFNWLAHKTD